MSIQPTNDLLGDLRNAHREIVAEWSKLTPLDFDRPSACSEWAIRDAIAHLRLLVTRYPLAVANGLSGRPEAPWLHLLPGETYATADRREWEEMRRRPGSALVSEFAENAAIMIEFFGALGPDAQKAPAPTPRGTFQARHVPFFYTYELVIHDWDARAGLNPSAGLRPRLVPAFLRIFRSRLPALVKQPIPPAAGRDWRIRLADPIGQTWLMTFNGTGFQVSDEADPAGPPDLDTDLDTLALITAARQTVAEATKAGRWRSADAGAGEAFGSMFAGGV